MKQHKWHKEIKAWADGLTIQYKDENFPNWIDILYPDWDTKSYIEFRIKPQPEDPQYLYVYYDADKTDFEFWDKTLDEPIGNKDYIGKIKIEVEDDI